MVQNDQEALEYAYEIFNVMKQTNWDVDPPNHTGPEMFHLDPFTAKPQPNDVDAHGMRRYKNTSDYLTAYAAWNESEIRRRIAEITYDDYGVSIMNFPEQPPNFDPKHPDPGEILMEAIQFAGIGDGMSSGGTVKPRSALILVGHRPREIRKRSPLVLIIKQVERWVARNNL